MMNKMGKGTLAWLVCAWLVVCLPMEAQANSWGLKSGALLDAVLQVNTWNDYNNQGTQVPDGAVMTSRYHNALCLVEHGEIVAYTTAVYQPSDARADRIANVSRENGTLILSYGAKEAYHFTDVGQGLQLTYAKIDDFEIFFHADTGEHFARQGERSIWYEADCYLRDFNITLFPRTIDEVSERNALFRALHDGKHALKMHPIDDKKGKHYASLGEGKAQVFTAGTFTEALPYIAGNAKATVSLAEELWLLRTTVDKDGRMYACIRYDVSNRTQRIGYVPWEALGLANAFSTAPDFISTSIHTNTQTYLTDDPDVSQYPLFTIPHGTSLTCLALYDENYAYVRTYVLNGTIGKGGTPIQGFVPLRDIYTGEFPFAPSVTAPPSQAPALGSIAYIHNPNDEDRLNLREDPRDDSPSLGKYYNGCPVTVLYFMEENWVKVRVGDDEGSLEGYMAKDYLCDDISLYGQAMPVITIQNNRGQGLHLREQAAQSSRSLKLYKNGTTIQVIGVSRDWYHVSVDGRTGFMMAEYFSPRIPYDKYATPPPKQETIGGNWAGPTGHHKTAEWPFNKTVTMATVNNPDPQDRLHLRSAPNTDAPSLAKYYNGTVFELFGDTNSEWVEVYIGSTHGYMKREFLTFDGTTSSAMPMMHVHNPNSEACVDFFWTIYPEGYPSPKEYQTLANTCLLYTLPNDTPVILMGFNGQWAHVIVGANEGVGVQGYILAKYLQ